MPSSFFDPHQCLLVVAARYMNPAPTDAADDILAFVQKHSLDTPFEHVVLSTADDPAEALSEVKHQSAKKIVLLVHGAVGAAAIRYLCDDFELPLPQRRVQWIHIFSVGLNLMRLEEVPHIIADPPVTNGKGAQAPVLAEWCLYSMLYFNRKTWQHQRNLREHRWEPYNISELYGKKVLIFGYGEIGREVASRAVAFNMLVTGFKRSSQTRTTDDRGTTVLPAEGTEVSSLLKHADFVVNCMPGTAQTQNYFNAERFSQMKPSAVYINVGRGVTTNERELAEALQADTIRGAALDVFQQEPLSSDSPLWSVDESKLLLTPHLAGQTDNQMEILAARFALLARKAAFGEDLHNFSINKEFLY